MDHTVTLTEAQEKAMEYIAPDVDDWISNVYRRFQKYKPLAQKIVNSGGKPRYKEERNKRLVLSQIENGVLILKKYLDNKSN